LADFFILNLVGSSKEKQDFPFKKLNFADLTKLSNLSTKNDPSKFANFSVLKSKKALHIYSFFQGVSTV